MEPAVNRNLIGQQLIRKGLISPEELEEALQFQRNVGGRLGKVLQKLGIIDGENFARFLAEEYNCAYGHYDSIQPDQNLFARYSRQHMKDRMFFPVRRTTDTVLLAMNDPTDLETIDLVAEREGRRVEIMAVSTRTVEHVLLEKTDGQEGEHGEPGEPAHDRSEQLPAVLQDLPAGILLQALVGALIRKKTITAKDILYSLRKA